MTKRLPSLASGALLALAAAGAFADLPHKQSNAGDSISQGFDTTDLPWDHPAESWVQGTDSRIDSVFQRYQAIVPGFSQQPESVTGAELVGGSNNFAAQASRICAQSAKPQHVSVLLGGNDVCNRPSSWSSDATANLYSTTTWASALDAGLSQLAACLPAGSTVHVLSMPRVDFLYDAGNAKSWWCGWGVWPIANVCRIVTGESDSGRREQIGQAINGYNDTTAQEVAAYQWNWNGQNPRGIQFVNDWQGSIESGAQNSSVGTYVFGPDDINIVDCFHPNVQGQHKLACAAWASNPDGSGSVAACLQ